MRAFIFDTETTDLLSNSLVSDDKQPRIIEMYAAIVEDDGSISEEFDEFFDPGIKISPEAVKITGITQDQVKGKPKFASHAARIKQMIARCEAMVAHNLAFDYAVLSAEFRRIDDNAPFPKDIQRICTVEATEWLKGYRLNLNALHSELFGKPFEGAHRAKTDATALIRCFNKLREQGSI